MGTSSFKNIGLILVTCLSSLLSAHPYSCKEQQKKYDYVIVGGGSAGCIAARKLSDNYHKSVLLIEAGGNYLHDPVILDPNWADNADTLLTSPKYAITYPYILGFLKQLLYSEGRQLGGGGAHNFLLTYRGTPSIYDLWASITGNPLWSYDGNVLNLMKALETYTPDGTVANLVQRGTNGPISILQNPPIVPVPGDFFSSLSSQTLTPFVADYNDPTTGEIGISALQQFITPPPNSRRSFSGLDFVGKVIKPDGQGRGKRDLTVLTNALALKIKFSKDMRAESVSYSITNSKGKEEIREARLKKKGSLILAAGSIQTPTLLMRSGVGPAAQLEAAGIPVVLDSPNVGQNLQCQHGTGLILTSPTPPFPFEAQVLLDGYPYMPNDGVRRIEVIAISEGPVSEMLPFLTNPKSRGSVSVVTNNPLIGPMVNIGVFTDGSFSTPGTDAYLQVSFFKIMKAAATAAGLTVIFPTPDDYASDAALFAAATDLNHLCMQSHIVGTARMGTNINNGVVDGNLNVFGLKNVKIGDNSIQPQSVNGNTCYSAYVIALVLCQTLGIPTPPAL